MDEGLVTSTAAVDPLAAATGGADRVATPPAPQPVATSPSAQSVAPPPAPQQVATPPAAKLVVPGAAREPVGATAAAQAIVAAGATQAVLAPLADDPVAAAGERPHAVGDPHRIEAAQAVRVPDLSALGDERRARHRPVA